MEYLVGSLQESHEVDIQFLYIVIPSARIGKLRPREVSIPCQGTQLTRSEANVLTHVTGSRASSSI